MEPAALRELQPLYAALHAWALRGMGYGIGDHPETSGERHVLELLASRAPKPEGFPMPVVFDVGANVGLWSAMVAQRFGANATLHAFEASPTAAKRLAEFLSGLGCGYRAHAFGLSDVERRGFLYTDAPGSGMASAHPRRLDHFGRALGDREVAKFLPLVDVVLGKIVDVDRIDLLKLDVEGHELAVLRGAGTMLETGAIRMIQFEFGGCNLDSRTTWQDFWYLLSPRYDLLRVVADGLVPIERYREQDEIYICSNFVAVWREP